LVKTTQKYSEGVFVLPLEKKTGRNRPFAAKKKNGQKRLFGGLEGGGPGAGAGAGRKGSEADGGGRASESLQTAGQMFSDGGEDQA
jgi:hypothetical protein